MSIGARGKIMKYKQALPILKKKVKELTGAKDIVGLTLIVMYIPSSEGKYI